MTWDPIQQDQPRSSVRWMWWLVTLACACGGSSPIPSSGGEEGRYSQGTYLVLLGTGNPNANPERSGPAVAVVVDGHSYLVDAGPGIVRRASAASAKGITALEPHNLRRVFVTHLHHDHTSGLADLILSPWTLDRDVPLQLHGPPGIDEMARHLLAAYDEDIRMRIEGLEPANAQGYQVEAHVIWEAGLVYEDERVRVTAFPVIHGSWRYAYGYRFETRDRTIVISGDATKSETIVEYCQECDILLHEVYSQTGWERRTPDWQEYHAQFHTSSIDLGDLASRARPKLLVIYHDLLMGQTAEELLREIGTHWNGRVVYGEDLDVF